MIYPTSPFRQLHSKQTEKRQVAGFLQPCFPGPVNLLPVGSAHLPMTLTVNCILIVAVPQSTDMFVQTLLADKCLNYFLSELFYSSACKI